MAHFVISFRIERDGTYQKRYDSLLDKVKEISTGYIWDETTSLYVLQAAGTSQSVANSLYYGTALSISDTLLVIDPINSDYSGYGIKHPALLSTAIGMRQAN